MGTARIGASGSVPRLKYFIMSNGPIVSREALNRNLSNRPMPIAILPAVVAALIAGWGLGTVVPASADDDTLKDASDRLVELLHQSEFVGRYTTDDGGGNLQPERYTIQSCQKSDSPQMYQLSVRIQYGGRDVTVPILVRIVMADQTPVITLDRVWVPGLGTFDARVLIRNRRYAGTWSHDGVGGHLFGRIEALKETGQ